MNVGSLFSGIGGIELGFEREGFKTIWFVENEPYCQAILRKHWPKTPIYGDIKKVDFTKLPKPDILTGGFPCQDISNAGKRQGIEGERSGLWKEFLRAIGEIRPRYAFVENVSALTYRGLLTVLGDLAKVGYDAEWHCIPASAFGAPHQRERVYILSYSTSNRLERFLRQDSIKKNRVFKALSSCEQKQMGYVHEVWKEQLSESYVRRMASGVPNRTHRIKCLGKAVVPQVAQFIARQIKERERGRQVS